ncbi:MAG TPA: hypothetical protein PK867_32060, partial [Pirellulales bacterium]|nr:hypothetical protein [Pirellulales bacterium]
AARDDTSNDGAKSKQWCVMALSQSEFETILADATKAIRGDIEWIDDEDHSPAVEFRAEVVSEAGFPLFIRGSYNRLAQTLTYALIHRAAGRIYALDLGKDHHNPDCQNVGEKHKHRWKEQVRDKEAYVPGDITAPASDPRAVWQQFCTEAAIDHQGHMHDPPTLDAEVSF